MSTVNQVSTNPLQAIGLLGVPANGKASTAQGSSTAPINGRAPQNQDPLAAIAALTGGKSSQGTKGVSPSAQKRIDKPEKIDNLYDLKTAVEAGQIEKISVCDLNAVAEFKNNKSHYVVKFTTSKGEGHKTHKFDVGEFVSPNQLEELQRVSVGNRVTFKSERIDPNVEGLKQIGLVLLPPVVGALIWIGSIMGIKSYARHEFKKLVKEKLQTNPDELGLPDILKIKLKNLKSELPGYSQEIRDSLESIGLTLETISKMTPEELEVETGKLTSLTFTGWAGTGKTTLQKIINWNLLTTLKDSKIKSAVLPISEIYKKISGEEGNERSIKIPSMFELSPGEEARLINEVCNDLGIHFIRLELADSENGGSQADALRRAAKLNKLLFDDVQDQLNKKKVEPKGFFNKITYSITNFIKGLFGQNTSDSNSYSLRTISIGVSTNADLNERSTLQDEAREAGEAAAEGLLGRSGAKKQPVKKETSAEFDAILSRFGKIIKIDNMFIHERYDMINNLLKISFPKANQEDRQNVALFVTQLTRPADPKVKSLPIRDMKAVIQTIMNHASTGNPKSLGDYYQKISSDVHSPEYRSLIGIVESELSKDSYTEESKSGLKKIKNTSTQTQVTNLLNQLLSDIQADTLSPGSSDT